jgi:hypothetical protein
VRGCDSLWRPPEKVALELPTYERQTSDNLVRCEGHSVASEVVGLIRHGVGMEALMRVKGLDLRYLLSWLLADSGHATVPELVDRLAMYGFDVDGRASKTVSDALRWEIRHGRVLQYGRGLYGPGPTPRATEYRIHQRIIRLRVQAGTLAGERATISGYL